MSRLKFTDGTIISISNEERKNYRFLLLEDEGELVEMPVSSEQWEKLQKALGLNYISREHWFDLLEIAQKVGHHELISKLVAEIALYLRVEEGSEEQKVKITREKVKALKQ